MRILITGGEGFIGTKLIHRILESGEHEVYSVDNFLEQVHGDVPYRDIVKKRKHLLVYDSIANRQVMGKVLEEFQPEVVIHLAADTGTSQSMSLMQRYAEVNVTATALLLELIGEKLSSVPQFIFASSRAVYGEGLWKKSNNELFVPSSRLERALAAGHFDPVDDPLSVPLATDESVTPQASSIYGWTKLACEQLIDLASKKLSMPTVIFRMQNVYGPGQSLVNPYTGLLTVFAERILRGERLDIYEDGFITRDFVYIDDVIGAFFAALSYQASGVKVINLGYGQGCTILDLAKTVLKVTGMPEDHYNVTGKYRLGDVRHAVANCNLSRELLNWSAKTSLEEGLREWWSWVEQRSSNQHRKFLSAL